MHPILFLYVLVSLAFPGGSPVYQSGIPNGTWVPVSQEMAGKPLPRAAFETQKLIISDTTYIVQAESTDRGVLRYSGSNRLDIYSRDGINIGKHFTAIYKYTGGQLTICYNLQGDSYPETFDTRSKPTLFMAVFSK